MVMINANARIERTCSRLEKSRSTAPTAGRNVMTVRMFDVIRSMFLSVSSQKPHHNRDSAEKDPAGIRTNIAGLHVAQTPCATADQVPGTVDQTIDDDNVDEFPKKLSRRTHNWPNKDRIVEFVDVVFVQHDRVHGVSLGRESFGQCGLRDIEGIREQQPSQSSTR